MKVLIADCYHDSDKGGGGLIAGSVASVREAARAHGVEPELAMVFRFSEDDPKFGSAARLTSKAFPGVPMLPAPISSRRGPGWRWLTWAWRVGVVAPLRLLFAPWSRHPAVRAMREADVVVFKGGNFYSSWSVNPLADALALLVMTYPLLLAFRLGRRFYLLSHTFGPFHSPSSRRLARVLLGLADGLSCREPVSSDILVRCGLPAERVPVSPDPGFAAYGADAERARRILERWSLAPGRYAAVTARPWFHKERKQGVSDRYDAYVARMAALCDYLAETHVEKVALVMQNEGSHSAAEPDIEPLRDILAHMRHPEAVLMDDDFAFDELISIYANAVLTLGTRLHSCVFSLCAGTPAIAVAYSHKARGIMGMAGMSEFILDIGDLSVDDGKRMIDDIVRRREAIHEHLVATTADLRQRLVEVTEGFLFGRQSTQA